MTAGQRNQLHFCGSIVFKPIAPTKGTHGEHLSVLDFKKQERTKEVAALEAAKQECQTDLIEMQEQLETAQTAVEAAEQRVQKAELTYQKQSQKLNKLAPIGRKRPYR